MTAVDRQKLGEWLSAYLDGELNAEQNAIIAHLLEEDGEVRQRLEELRAVSRMVFELPRHAPPPSILQDIRRQTERDALLGDAEDDRATVAGQPRFGMRLLATAAMVAVAVGGAYWAYRVLPGRSATPGTSLVSRTPTHEDAPDGRLGLDLTEQSPSKQFATPGAALADTRSARSTDLATFEQKIEHRAATEELVNHPFANEANVVTLTYATNHDRDATLSLLTDTLRNARIDKLNDNESGREVRQMSVFIEGRVGVNFVGPQDRQVLVRVPKDRVESLVREIESPADVDARMQVGPITVHGRDQVTQLAAAISHGGLASSPEARARPAFGDEAEAMNELLVALNLDKRGDWLTPGADRESTAGDDRATSSETATPSGNGVSLPGRALAEAPSGEGTSAEGTSAEDSPKAKSTRRTRSRAAGRRSTTAAASPKREPPRSADTNAFAAKKEAAPSVTPKVAGPEKETPNDTSSNEKGDTKDDQGAEAPVTVLPDRTPLAVRRLAEIRREAAAVEAPVPVEATQSRAPDSDDFVTLVIQLVSREPVRPAALPAKQKPRSTKSKPTEKTKADKPKASQ